MKSEYCCHFISLLISVGKKIQEEGRMLNMVLCRQLFADVKFADMKIGKLQYSGKDPTDTVNLLNFIG